MSHDLNAINLLEGQHREMEELFDKLEMTSGGAKQKVFKEIANKLAIHATIEERDFYPAVKAKRTEDATQEELIAKGDPSKAVPSETKHAAEL